MKLGIIVVYLLNEDDGKLLDLHLNQIEKHTKIPYTIYGSVNRLLPQFRQKLEQHPQVKIYETQTTDWRESAEHIFYLNKLIPAAIEDGATHLAVMHVDSFPVRSGWAKELISKLSDSCVLAAIKREENSDYKPNSACMLFHRDFYLKYHPKFLLSDEEKASPQYKQYLKENHHYNDAGVGYGFKIYSEGLSWYPLLRSNKANEHNLMASVYDDLIFHLLAAARHEKLFYGDRITRINIAGFSIPLGLVRKILSVILPDTVKLMIKGLYGKLSNKNNTPDNNEKSHEIIRKHLFENPETYINYLRTGKREIKV